MQALWLALHLPQLPLETHPGLPSPSAVAARGRVAAMRQPTQPVWRQG
jgi:hypothetical protein